MGADLGSGNALAWSPGHNQIPATWDRTRKKAWVHRSKVGPTSRVALAI